MSGARISVMLVGVKGVVGRYFHWHGLFCATHPFFMMYVTILAIIICSYPAVRVFDSHLVHPMVTKSAGTGTAYEPIHFWDQNGRARSSMEQDKVNLKFNTEPYLRMDQILVSLTDPEADTRRHHNQNGRSTPGATVRGGAGMLSRPLLLSLFDLQEAVAKFAVLGADDRPFTLDSICFKVRDRCLVNSPLEFWHTDREKFLADDNIFGTISQSNWESSFGPPISARSVFGGISSDPKTGMLRKADSFVLTYFLEVSADASRDETVRKWESFWESFISSNAPTDSLSSRQDASGSGVSHKLYTIERTPGTPKHLYYKFHQPQIHDSAEFWLLAICYFLVFLYISLSLGRIELVKSKFGLGFSAVFTIFASLVMSVGTCAVIGVELSLVPWEVLPFVLMVVGVENTFLITKSVVSTSLDLPVKERIGRGLGLAGYQMTVTLLAEFILMLIGSVTSVPSLQEFCTFATFAVLYDYLLHITLFTTILSIDIRRLELTDLQDHRVVRVLRTPVPEESPTQKRSLFKGKGGLGCGIMIVIMVTLGFGLYGTTTSLQSFSWDSSFLSTARLPKGDDADIFWTVINPSHLDKYVEIQPPVHIAVMVHGASPQIADEMISDPSPPTNADSFVRIKMILNGYLLVLRPYYEGGGLLLFGFSVFAATLLSCTLLIFIYFNIPFILAKFRDLLDPRKELRQSWVKGSYRELTLVGHVDDVECYFCSNNILASAALDRTVRLWDITTGENLGILRAHRKTIWHIQIFENWLASGSSDGMICLWEVSSATLTFELGNHKSARKDGDISPGDEGRPEGHREGITCLKFDPDDKVLFSGSIDKSVKLWDLQTGSCIGTFLGHKGPVTCLDVNSDVFVSGSEDGTLRVYSKKSRTCRLTLYGHLVGITSLTLNPLSSAPTLSGASGPAIADSPQAKVISASQDGVVRIWDLGTGTCNCVLTGHTSSVVSLLVDNAAASLVTSSLDETVRIWNLASIFRTRHSPTASPDVQRSPLTPALTIRTPGSTGVALVDSIVCCGGVGSVSLHSLQALIEIRQILFDDEEQEDFDAAVIISKLASHETGIVFDYGSRLKVFHFSGVAVKKKLT